MEVVREGDVVDSSCVPCVFELSDRDLRARARALANPRS